MKITKKKLHQMKMIHQYKSAEKRFLESLDKDDFRFFKCKQWVEFVKN